MSETSLVPASALARELGVNRRTVYRWIINEELQFPRPKVICRRLYFPRQEIEFWLRGKPRGIK